MGCLYLVGSCCVAGDESLFDQLRRKCPRCVKEGRSPPGRIQSRADQESMSQRFRWILEHVHGYGGDSYAFPCLCDPQPPCRLLGELEFKVAVCGDTCFGCSDDEWVRALGEIQCCGCHARGKLALLENHPSWSLHEAGWYGPPR